MKNRFLVAMTMLLVFSLFGCSGGDQESPPDAIGASEPSESVTASEEPVTTGEVDEPKVPGDEENPSAPSAPTTAGANKWVELPAIEDVTLEDSALLWDFVHGTLGWHTDIYYDTMRNDEYLLHNVKRPEVIYHDYYTIRNPGAPLTGSGIACITFEGEQLDAVLNAMSKVPEERVLRDGDWELYLLIYEGANSATIHDPIEACFTYYDSTGEMAEAHTGLIDRNGARYDCFGGVSISYFAAQPMPLFDYHLTWYAQGGGFPADWLRKEPWRSNLLRDQQIDVSDAFWDDWVYQAQYIVTDKDFGRISGYVIPIRRGLFEIHIDEYSSGDSVLTLTSEQLFHALESDGLEIINMMDKFEADINNGFVE